MSDRKTIVVSIMIFLTGVAASVAGAIIWASMFAIVAPLAAGMAAIIIVTAEGDR